MAHAECQASLLQAVPLCKICDEVQPVIYCNECRQSMCDSCKTLHNEIHGFDKHSTSPLCKKHTGTEPVTHICHKCLKSMCIKCMIREHKTHGEDFTTFDNGIQMIKEKSKEDAENILREKEKLDAKLEEIEMDCKKNEEFKEGMKKLRTAYIDKISKIDNVQNDLEENCEKEGQNLIKETNELSVKCFGLAEALNKQSGNDLEYVENSATLAYQKEILKVEVDKLLQIKTSLFPPEGSEDDLLVLLAEANLSHLAHECFDNPHVVVHYVHNEIRENCIALLPDRSVVFAQGNPWKILKLDLNGVAKSMYQPNNEIAAETIRGLDVYKSHLFILTANDSKSTARIILVSLDNMSSQEYQLPDPAFYFRVLDENKLFYSLFPCLGLHIVNFKDCTIACKYGSDWIYDYISVLTLQCERYTAASKQDHFLHIFNEKNQRVRSIGYQRGSKDGELQASSGHVGTPNGKVLIADTGNDRVSCFELDGRFVQNVLTINDGIKSPRLLAYSPLYLWVLFKNEDWAIKCFKFAMK